MSVMSKRYWIETYGCQMNKAESGSLELELRARGWEPAAGPAAADAVVVNTCSVRQTAEDRIWGRLGFLKAAKRRRPFRLVLMGCMAERLKEEILRQAPQVDLLVGSFQKHRLAQLLDAPNDAAGVDGAAEWSGVGAGCLRTGAAEWSGVGAGRLHTGAAALTGAGPYRFSEAHSRGELRAFLPIMHGCDNFCTYCIVPYVRGREVSRSPESVLRELRELLPPAGAARDITLLGQNVNSYRYASGPPGPGCAF
jgi:tRNA-2-methylthio-N6-dimethylallyladenosine synthase